MTARKGSGRPWLEGFVIVLSILLAFGIEASWSELGDRREARRLRELIRVDVVATQSMVEQMRVGSERLANSGRDLLAVLADPASEEATADALLTLGSIFVLWRWAPTNHAYVEALSSGRLRFIEDEQLRLTLTRYQAQLESIEALVESIETQYYGQLEPFMVANTVYSEIAMVLWRDSLVDAPFSTDFQRLAQSRELWNLLTFRLEMELGLQLSLDRLDRVTQQVLDLLPSVD
jgi:hypothetical protein